MLRVSELAVAYGQVQALRGVSLHVGPGETVCLIGANGAGKSSLLNAISGLVPAVAGHVEIDGRPVPAGTPAHRLVRRGIVQIPEGRQLFMELSVRENLRLGAYAVGWSREARERLDEVYGWFPVLRERAGQPAGALSGGEQQMLAIGRGLMARPRLLLIDEPSLGLSPILVKENFNIIRQINERGITVFLVEQNVRQTLAISHYGYVLSKGRVVVGGTPAEIADRPEVREAYFG
jgi:branched-chain amino acid transport system ATP-binding protein